MVLPILAGVAAIGLLPTLAILLFSGILVFLGVAGIGMMLSRLIAAAAVVLALAGSYLIVEKYVKGGLTTEQAVIGTALSALLILGAPAIGDAVSSVPLFASLGPSGGASFAAMDTSGIGGGAGVGLDWQQYLWGARSWIFLGIFGGLLTLGAYTLKANGKRRR